MKIGKIKFDDTGNMKVSSKLKEIVKKYIINSGLLREENLKNQEIYCFLNNGTVRLRSTEMKECNLDFGNSFRSIENMEVMHPVRIPLGCVKDGELFYANVAASKYLCTKIKDYGYYNIAKGERLFTTMLRELPENSKYRANGNKLRYESIKAHLEVTKYILPEV